MRRRII